MLERILTPDNILDRVAALERRLAELEAGAVTVQVVQTPASGTSSALNGWLATGSAFMDISERVVLDASLPGIRLDSGGVIYSADYQAGVSGFKIDGGEAEFNDVVVRGTIYASVGQIGGWSIGTNTLTGGSATLHSSGYLLLGSGNDIARLDASDATYRLWIGNANAASAPFRVTKAGALTATGATIAGTITAIAGAFTGSVTVGSSSPYIVIDGANKRIRTSTYTAGSQGFTIESNGTAEFNNVVIRGALRAATFLYGQILATGGTLVLAKASGKLYADCTTETSFYVDIADPDGMSHAAAGALWAVNDIIRLKEPLTGDVWGKVTAKTDMTTYWRLTVSLQSGSTGLAFRAGMAVVNYGQSGQGVLRLTADDANGPFYSVQTHAGSPWSAATEVARLGNLSGNWGYSAAAYGLALGEYAASKANLVWDPTNGLRLRTYSTTVLQLDNSGNALITGVLNLGSAGGIYQGTGTFASPTTGLKIWNDGGIGRLATYNSGTAQVYFDTYGVLKVGGGSVSLSAAGLRLLSTSIQQDQATVVFYCTSTSAGAAVRQDSSSTEGTAVLARIYSVVGTADTYIALPTYQKQILGSWSTIRRSLNLWARGASTDAHISIEGDGGASGTYGISLKPGSGKAVAVYGYIDVSTPLGCFVYRTTTQSIPNNTLTALSWGTEAWDNGGCWSSANPTRLVAPVDGYYAVGGGWMRDAANNPNASRHAEVVAVYTSGGTLQYHAAINEVHTIASRNVGVHTACMVYLQAGWYVQVLAYQDSGAGRQAYAGSATSRHHNCGWMFRIA